MSGTRAKVDAEGTVTPAMTSRHQCIKVGDDCGKR
jgi:hypothetical protein